MLKNNVVEKIKSINDWQNKYEFLIELGKNLGTLSDKYKTKDNLISNCQSETWIDISEKNGKIILRADSNTIINKGILSILLYELSGKTPKEILKFNVKIFEEMGLSEHLAPTRMSGINSILKKINEFAKKLI